MWWTITGNFGNILPIDWSKTYACKMHIPALHLDENKVSRCFSSSLNLIAAVYFAHPLYGFRLSFGEHLTWVNKYVRCVTALCQEVLIEI
jgi:FEZ-like protein